MGWFAIDFFVVADGVAVRLVHDDEYAVVGHSVEGDGIEHPDGIVDNRFPRVAGGIKLEIETRAPVADEHRHVMAEGVMEEVLAFADFGAAIEVHFDAHDGVGGREHDGPVLLFGNDAVVAPVAGERGIVDYVQVEFETFGMDVVRGIPLLKVPDGLLAVCKPVFGTVYGIACVDVVSRLTGC